MTLHRWLNVKAAHYNDLAIEVLKTSTSSLRRKKAIAT